MKPDSEWPGERTVNTLATIALVAFVTLCLLLALDWAAAWR